MKKMTFLTVCVILLLALNAVTLFILFHEHMDKQQHLQRASANGPSDFIIRELKLDDQQQSAFAELRTQHRQTIAAEEREDHRLHDLYFDLLKSDSPDKAKTDSIGKMIGEQRSKMAAATFEHFKRLRQLCRDDQKRLFDGVIDEIAKRVAGPPPADGPPPPPIH